MWKSQIQQAYVRYLWEKCSRSTYYKRIKQWMSIEEALKPVTDEDRHRKWKIRSSKFQEELEWYYNQKWEKVDRKKFYQRLYKWYSKEQAIKIDFEFTKTSPQKRNKPLYKRPITPIQKAEPDSDRYEIRIKYSKEEAQIIKNEYIRIIDDLEWKRSITEDLIESKEIQKQLNSLKKEYELFCFASS